MASFPTASLSKPQPLSFFFKGLAVSGLVFCLWKMFKPETLHQKIQELNAKIQESNNYGDYHLQQMRAAATKIIQGKDLKIELQLVPVLISKQKQPTTKFSEETKLLKHQDPFLPPYQKGKLICNLSSTHVLLYNKYIYCKNHLLIVTSKFQDQAQPLSIDDWKQSILVIRALKGLIFYNCGNYSGYTQSHKHVQVLSDQGFKFSQIKLIYEAACEGKLIEKAQLGLHHYSGFDFVHGIAVLPQNSEADKYQAASNRMLSHFKAMLGVQDLGYNIISWQRHILMIPRRQSAIFQHEVVSANIFLGLAMIKDAELFYKLDEKTLRAEDLLARITFKWPQP